MTEGAVETLGRFGAFESILRNGGYHSLLYGAIPEVLGEVQVAVQKTTDILEAVSLLLDERNWRTDLVAIAAALLSEKPTDLVGPLWEAFDYGSWVAPQLAVSLYLVDPGFREMAKHRVGARCAPASGAIVRPGPWDRISAKNLASLLQVLHRVDDERAWVADVRRARDVRQILKLDNDSASAITDRWSDSISRALIEVGRPLGGFPRPKPQGDSVDPTAPTA